MVLCPWFDDTVHLARDHVCNRWMSHCFWASWDILVLTAGDITLECLDSWYRPGTRNSHREFTTCQSTCFRLFLLFLLSHFDQFHHLGIGRRCSSQGWCLLGLWWRLFAKPWSFSFSTQVRYSAPYENNIIQTLQNLFCSQVGCFEDSQIYHSRSLCISHN